VIIGLSGFAGVGKDTIADCLVLQHGFTKISVADPVKRTAMSIFGFTNGQLWGPSAMREQPDIRYPREHTFGEPNQSINTSIHCRCCGIPFEKRERQCFLTPRYALQLLGTEYGRHCYDSIWIQLAMRTATTLLKMGNVAYSSQLGVYELPNAKPPAGVVLPDIRFRNELEGIKKYGKHQDELVNKLIEQWHNQQQVGAAREQTLAEFLGMTEAEYATFVESAVHRTSSYVVKVSRPGFERPRYQHQSELEQLSFKMEEFDYNFIGVSPPDELSEAERNRKILDTVAEGVAEMLGSFLKLK
jgi:hypothetical protein